MIILRKYRKFDQKQVFKLVDDVIWEIFGFGVCNAHDLWDIKKHYVDKGGVFYIAADGNTVIGTIGVFLMEDGYAKIKRMYVYKEYRRRGIGQRLMDKVMEFCESKHYDKIKLTTYPQMKAAIAFYTKNGFKKMRIAEDGGIIMVLRLVHKRVA